MAVKNSVQSQQISLSICARSSARGRVLPSAREASENLPSEIMGKPCCLLISDWSERAEWRSSSSRKTSSRPALSRILPSLPDTVFRRMWVFGLLTVRRKKYIALLFNYLIQQQQCKNEQKISTGAIFKLTLDDFFQPNVLL